MYNIFNVIWFELIWFAWYDLKRDWRGSIWFNVGGSKRKRIGGPVSHGEWTTWVLGFVATIFPRLLSIETQQLVTVDAVDAVETATGRRLNHWSYQPYPKMNRSGTISHGFLVVFHSHIAHSPMIKKNDRGRCCTLDLLSCTQRWRRSPIHQMMVFHMSWGVRFS